MEDRPGGLVRGGSGTHLLTDLLQDWHAGSEQARNRVFELTYRELRRLAAAYLRQEHEVRSLQATALVHEAFLRLIGNQAPWIDRRHFYGVAAQAMRRILVDHARRRSARKRPRMHLVTGLEELADVPDRETWATVRLEEALLDLERLDPRQARVVELRHFVGLSVEETASTLGLSAATVKRDWATARAWIARHMHGSRS
jgi:RNA polymerase sigma-70 factor (ECF subfamily)